MTVTNPLTPGVYRIDLPCERAADFGKWRRAQRGKVALLELEEGPGGTARVSFVVFKRPGAFPFGRLGKPVPGAIVGALPDWKDVVRFALQAVPGVELAFQTAEWVKFFHDHAQPEFDELKTAISVTRANVAIIRAQLEAVAHGTAKDPAAVLHNAAAMVAQSIALLLDKAGAIPLAFPRHLVNHAIEELDALGKAIASAPGKALHAISEFVEPVAGFGGWILVAAAGLAMLGGGGYIATKEGKISDNVKNFMLLGGALLVVGELQSAVTLKPLFEKILMPEGAPAK